jgi:hypothetical protein
VLGFSLFRLGLPRLPYCHALDGNCLHFTANALLFEIAIKSRASTVGNATNYSQLPHPFDGVIGGGGSAGNPSNSLTLGLFSTLENPGSVVALPKSA